MLETINEPVEVVAVFKPSGLIPVKFLWRGRPILIKKVNLAYSKWAGRVKFHYFAVSDGANFFKLQFNSDNLSWILLEVYSE